MFAMVNRRIPYSADEAFDIMHGIVCVNILGQSMNEWNEYITILLNAKR